MRLRKFSSSLRGGCSSRRSNLLIIEDCFVAKERLLAMTWDIHKINRPSRLRRAIGFDLDYPSTSKASPDDTGIVIVIIIVVGEVVVEHGGGIIAQSLLF
jgi:hypothetical protein